MLILIRHQLVIVKILNLHLRIMNKQQQMERHQIQDTEQQQIQMQHRRVIILLKK